MHAFAIAIVGALLMPVAASAQVKVIISGGFSGPYEKLLPEFQRTTGIKVTTGSGASQGTGPQTIAAQLAAGAVFDVVICSREGLDELIAAKKIMPGTDVDVAMAPLGVAVRAGAPKPDIGSVEAFRRTLLSAKSIVATDPAAGAASGIHFAKLIEKLGIADAVKAKTRLNSGSYNAEFVARGEAELAIQQISEILPVKGAELVGPLPADIQVTTLFKVAIAADASEPAGARELIAFLRSRAAAQVIAASGMEPA
jgi:molybdate transport system substrate-binding protein